jgi:hypothetical protein
MGGALLGEVNGVSSKGVMAGVLRALVLSKFERLDGGLVTGGCGLVGNGARSLCGAGSGFTVVPFFKKRPELSLACS